MSHISARRIFGAAAATTAIALAATAGPAMAAPTDPVLLNNAELAFGTTFVGNDATVGGTLDWNQSGATTTPRLTGNLYIQNAAGVESRMVIEHYPSATDHSTHIDRQGGTKIGTGVFLNAFSVLVGGVNSTYTHVHVLLQKKEAGVWRTKATSIQSL
jgi:hypothetical protein